MNVSLLIIAGGKSSRLGVDKRFAEVGGEKLLEKILRKSTTINFVEKFLCTEKISPELELLADKYGAKILIDEIPDAGALSGIANGLKNIKADWALAVSADMPFFDFKALEPLTEKFSGVQAVIPICGGKYQTLAAFYNKNLAKLFYEELASGQRKIISAIKKIPHAFIEFPAEEIFFNVNTRADLRLARGRAENLSRPTPIISIVAPESGTGKTTFIERLTKIFSEQGIKIGVIKSDAHGFNLDVAGKDSWRFQQAGAKSVAVVSPKSWFMIQKTSERENFLSVSEKMNVDLIFTEGRTQRIFPTISLWRGHGDKIADENICAIFSSMPETSAEICEFDLDDTISAERILKFLAGF